MFQFVLVLVALLSMVLAVLMAWYADQAEASRRYAARPRKALPRGRRPRTARRRARRVRERGKVIPLHRDRSPVT